MLTDVEKNRIEKIHNRERRASPPPWEELREYGEWYILDGDGYGIWSCENDGSRLCGNDNDNKFIIFARSDIPFLLSIIKRQENEINILKNKKE
jgi:hypothetical protein